MKEEVISTFFSDNVFLFIIVLFGASKSAYYEHVTVDVDQVS